MKYFLTLILSCFFTCINGQTIKGGKFTNSRIGVSIYFDSTWRLSYTKKDSMFTAANYSKTEMVTFHYLKSQTPTKIDKFTTQQIEATKVAYKNKYELDGHTVLNISVKNDRFLNYDCFFVIAHLKDQDYMNGIPIYKKQISFVTNNGYLVSFIYIIPERIYTFKEISYVETQLKTFAEF